MNSGVFFWAQVRQLPACDSAALQASIWAGRRGARMLLAAARARMPLPKRLRGWLGPRGADQTSAGRARARQRRTQRCRFCSPSRTRP